MQALDSREKHEEAGGSKVPQDAVSAVAGFLRRGLAQDLEFWEGAAPSPGHGSVLLDEICQSVSEAVAEPRCGGETWESKRFLNHSSKRVPVLAAATVRFRAASRILERGGAEF